MALGAVKAIVGMFADINVCREFFTWVIPGIIAARHQLLDQDDTDAHHQIHEVREQLRQLENDLWKLRTTMAPKMLDLIDRVEWQSHKKPAADLLPDIKDAVYDAEDLLDEFNYYAIKLGVEQSKNSGQEHVEGAFLRFYNSIKDCAHFSKVKEIQDKLDHIFEQSMDFGLHQAPQKFDRSIRRETCSFSDEPQIFGREKELEQLVQKLGVRAGNRGSGDGEERMTELPVLPIVGMGGVGKTSMAQQIYNDARVNAHFDFIVWTCVLDDFNIKRLTREILQHLGKQTQVDDNLNVLMKNLASCVRSKKFLLVLDDMWDDILKEGRAEWKRFCKPLENGLQGSMILVTTRSSEVGCLVGTMNHYELAGLPDDVLWMFFKLQAFRSKSPSNDAELECIGKAILPKLKGSPLAAKTIGRLLSRDLNTTHWKYILESELWQLEQDATDILPALRLSYMYLPPHLKKCFSICALYPKDHVFEKEVLCDIWIAHGYVQPEDASSCFDDLANRSFFQREFQQSAYFRIHDLIHDMARLVSKDECFTIKHASDLHKIPSNARHLSLSTNGNVGFSELKSICNKKKLRSLFCNEYYSSPTDFAPVIDTWFKELLKIRVLSFKLSGITQLPESMGNSKHLRYLCLLTSSTSLIMLPSSICCLHRLKTIEARECEFESFPQGFNDVISLQKINFRRLHYKKDNSDRLRIHWFPAGISGEKQEHMMEELPHCHWNLQHLELENYKGASCPSWLRPNTLPRLRSLKFCKCDNQSISFFEPLGLEQVPDNLHPLEVLCIVNCASFKYIGSSEAGSSCSSVGAFSSLATLTLIGCGGLLSLDEFLTPAYLPALKNIHIESCIELMSLPVDRLHGFSCLEEITIRYCPKLNTQRVMRLPSSLKNLFLMRCGGIQTIDFRQSGSSLALKRLYIANCLDLRSIGASVNVSQTEHVHISGCPQLTVCEASSTSNSVLAFSSLECLTLIGCGGLLSLDEFLTPAYLPAVKNIRIESCQELTSLPVDRLNGFSCLVEMIIHHCPKLNTHKVMRLPSSLKSLNLHACGGIETIELCQLGTCPALEGLRVGDCPDLRSIGGGGGGSINVALAKNVLISSCPQLKEIEQPFYHGNWYVLYLYHRIEFRYAFLLASPLMY
ncbi:hypothetical protein ZWY2020_045658 [Hordeum vulgare]|nr:hypothetical protein ZWY2020_045658 [Hordeum vulgare]